MSKSEKTAGLTESTGGEKHGQDSDDNSKQDSDRKPTCLDRAYKLCAERLQDAPRRVAIFAHPVPDPDAIGSMMGLSWFMRKAFDVEVDCFYDGVISHPQNVSVVNLLDPELKNMEDFQTQNYALRMLVDTVPSHAAVGKNQVDFDLVFDHHKETPNGGFRGIFVNLKAGSCCATIYQFIKSRGLAFDSGNDRDSQIATAMMVGIATDTENLLSDDTTEYEFEAYWKLFPYRDSDALKKIVNYKRPKSWVDAKANASREAVINGEGVGVVGLGFINSRQRDLIADVADEMSTWVNVETAIAFAVVDGDRIEGSVRSTNPSVSVPALCKELGMKCGSGGGKLGKGAYRYGLGGVSVEEDEEEDTRAKMWEFIKTKETRRITKIARGS
jgi:nanoRNase/pAp phosphatase (c-di-AMP/oligoRNAs hydrolase)